MLELMHDNMTVARMNISAKKKSVTPSIEIYECENWCIGNMIVAKMTIVAKAMQLEWHLGKQNCVGKS